MARVGDTDTDGGDDCSPWSDGRLECPAVETRQNETTQPQDRETERGTERHERKRERERERQKEAQTERDRQNAKYNPNRNDCWVCRSGFALIAAGAQGKPRPAARGARG